MAPIANLVVRLSAQISEFQKSFTDATAKIDKFGADFSKTAAAIESNTKGIAGSFNGIVQSAAGVAAGMITAQAAIGAVGAAFSVAEKAIDATFGAIKASVLHTSELGDSLFTLSQKTGLSVESLSAFKFVAGQTGTSLETITGAVFKLESNLGAGAKKTADAIKGLGLSLKDLRSQDPAQAFGEIIAKLGELPNASARAATGVAIFGKSFKDIAQLSQENLPELIAQAKELGVVMSQETAVAADRFNDAMGVIRAGAEGLQLQLGAKLLPAVIAFAEAMGEAWKVAAQNAGISSEQIGKAVDTLVPQIARTAAQLIQIFASLVDAVVQWSASTVLAFAGAVQAQIDFANTAIKVARVMDQITGGNLVSVFDRMETSVREAQGTLDALVKPVLVAGAGLRALAGLVEQTAKSAGDNFASTYQRIQSEIAASATKMRASLKAIGDGGIDGASDAKDAFSAFGKQLADLTAQIDRAVLNKTPLAEVVRLFGDEAAKAVPKARAWGIAVSASVADVSQEFNRLAKNQTLEKLSDGFTKFANKRFEKTFEKLQAGAHEGAVAFVEFEKTLEKLDDGFSAFANKRFERTFERVVSGMESADAVAQQLSNSFGRVFTRVGKELAPIFARALQQGGFTAALVAVAEGATQQFGEVFDAGMKRVTEEGGTLTKGEQAAGWGAALADSFVTGFTNGLQGFSPAGLFSSLVQGGLSGFAVGGGPGAFAGLAVSLASFYLGIADNAEKAKEAVRTQTKELVTQFHGLDELNRLAERANLNLLRDVPGGAGGPSQSVEFLLNQDTVEGFNAQVALLNRALDEYNQKLKAIDSATAGVNTRTATFAEQFAALVEQQNTARGSGDLSGVTAASEQIQELAQRTQPEFERLGLIVENTFAAIVRESGDAIGAITALGPSFDVLKSGITDFGLTSTGVIDSLLGSFDLIKSEITGPFIQNVQASGQILKGLFDAKALNADTFQALATDIGQSLQEVANRGGDMEKALALSAPVLQTLWEAQERYGTVTDQTTQSILNQAEEQGLVGAAFKETNEKILDILLEINRVLGGAIPDSLRAVPRAAAEAGAGIETAFGGALTATAASVDATVGQSLRGLGKPASEAGAVIRQELETQASQASTFIETSLSRSFDGPASAAVARAKEMGGVFGNVFDRLGGQAKIAAGQVETALAGIDIPEITLPVTIDLDSSAIDRLDITDPRIRTGFDIPALADGGIVRRRTLAIVGEAGPEVVVPLSRIALLRPSSKDSTPSSVVFGPGSVVIQGDVDTTERANRVVRDFAKAIRRNGDARTLALRSLGMEKV